jgi:hypothetical protein
VFQEIIQQNLPIDIMHKIFENLHGLRADIPGSEQIVDIVGFLDINTLLFAPGFFK